MYFLFRHIIKQAKWVKTEPRQNARLTGAVRRWGVFERKGE